MRLRFTATDSFVVFFVILGCFSYPGHTEATDSPLNCYRPLPGGYAIHISPDHSQNRLDPHTTMGLPDNNSRLHRRPLYPPAAREMIWDVTKQDKLARVPFRPLILAYNEPRFLFDYHIAGGLLGHLLIGIQTDEKTGKWFHQFSDVAVHYINGRMDYTLQDTTFPETKIQLSAAALSESVGLVVRIQCSGLQSPAHLVWAYGGASAFSTNYNMIAPEFIYSPTQCTKNFIAWNKHYFTLRRPFDKDDVYQKPFPEWEARIQGGSSKKGDSGYGDPDCFSLDPNTLLAGTQWITDVPSAERGNCVAVQQIPLEHPDETLFIAVGMGGAIEEVLQNPAQSYAGALARNAGIAERIVTHTPDPYLDAAVPMMAFATEGTWGDIAYLHGAWSWRNAYLGWRGHYGPTCYGWTDRVRHSIRNHATLGLIQKDDDKGAISHILDHEPKSTYYNMNEVFFDHVRQYFDYTGDLDLMRELMPVMEGILEWENRRLQPEHQFLYENCLNTWISDSHWYIGGQCAQASAYMLGAHRFLAELAKRLGRDAQPYLDDAQRIRDAMQKVLWMPRSGVFAEYRDTLGNRMLHSEPELPTIYHSAEFGAADSLQIYEMLHWADTHLPYVTTPGGGKQYWSSNWFPNRGRSYTHSTYEMAYAEELNFALTNYLAGREEEAYALITASLCGIFNGDTPGGLSCHSYTDGRQRANDEFADAISMWARTMVEGLFGIVPKRADEIVHLTPQFPSEWTDASIKTPHFSYVWHKQNEIVSIEWESPVPTSVHLHLALKAQMITEATCDGEPIVSQREPGVGLTWVTVQTPKQSNGTIQVSYEPLAITIPETITLRQGEPYQSNTHSITIADWRDPQGILKDAELNGGILHGTVVCEPGPALLFLSPKTEDCPYWIPIRMQIEPQTPPPAKKIWKAPNVPDRDINRWVVANIDEIFNVSLTVVPARICATAKPPALPASQVGFGYMKDHWGIRLDRISDEAWRAKVGQDGVAWTTDGIPFHSPKEGPNISVVSLLSDFPSQLEFPIHGRGSKLYLMVSGGTFPVQSHVTNLRITLHYEDGENTKYDLVNPFDIGDCWGTCLGRYHDTAANGFENLGGLFGPAGSSQVDDLTQPVAVDTEAHLLEYDLRPESALHSVELEAIANDCAYGLMGATILK